MAKMSYDKEFLQIAHEDPLWTSTVHQVLYSIALTYSQVIKFSDAKLLIHLEIQQKGFEDISFWATMLQRTVQCYILT